MPRPRKPDIDPSQLNPTELKKQELKNYMRGYVKSTNKEITDGIDDLEKKERDCLIELNRIRVERKKLIDDLESSNNQAGNILKEKTIRVPKEKPKPKVAPLPPKKATPKPASKSTPKAKMPPSDEMDILTSTFKMPAKGGFKSGYSNMN